MLKIILSTIEIFSFVACAIFGYMWTQDPNGNYEPWLFLAGLVFLAFEMFRRYEKELFSKDGKISSIIPWFRHWLNRPIIVRHQRDNWWHMGATGNKEPSMQVVSYWYITNQTNRPIKILNAYIVKPRVYGHVMTKDVKSQYHGSYPVPPNTTTDLHADFWINPPIRRIGKDLLVDIVFVDQYGQKRKIRNIEFPSDKKKTSSPKCLQVEAVYALENDIEKKVAAVLKDEINRYKKFGRLSGELGSIHAICNSGKVKSIYQDSWTDSKSGERQEILTDTENSSIRSENGDALVNYYNGLQNESDRDLFLNSLISRINRNKEYYCVIYLILYVLFRIGHLKDGLGASELNLQLQPSLFDRILHRKPKEELLELHQRYGFSDALGLINGLLRYEHHSFTNNELDLIEQFISNVDEYAFKIDEKINSIRSYRLSK